MNSLLTTLPVLLPIVTAWAEKEEEIILQQGAALSPCQLADARRAGVASPEKIRVARVEVLPHPENEDIMFLARRVGLFGSRSMGITFGYGVCLRPDAWDNRLILVHECVHVSQYERLNGARSFLGKYLRQCIDPGYPFGSLEQEAINVARDICKSPEYPQI